MEKSLVTQGRLVRPAELEPLRGWLAAHPGWSGYLKDLPQPRPEPLAAVHCAVKGAPFIPSAPPGGA